MDLSVTSVQCFFRERFVFVTMVGCTFFVENPDVQMLETDCLITLEVQW